MPKRRKKTEEDRLYEAKLLSLITERQILKNESIKSINTAGECCAYMGPNPGVFKCNCVSIPCLQCYIYANYKPTEE